MKKGMKIAAATMSLVMMLTACAGGSKPEQTTGAGDTKTEAAKTEAAKAEDAQIITIWYEGGDARLPFFQAVEAEMQKDYPNYSINAVTFDNSTFMTKVLQAATATGGVDLAFNDASRLLEIDLQSNLGFEDLSEILNEDEKNSLVSDGDKKLSSSAGRLVVYPVNRTIAGLGVKTDVAGVEITDETKPATWDQFVELGTSYKNAGINGFTMILGSDPGQVFNLFLCGSGMSDVFLNGVPESQIEKNKTYFENIVLAYAGANGFWDKDATSEDFAAMYTKIQSGSVGMFRAGNWNVTNWDKADSGVGAYEVMPWPALSGDGKSGLVLLNTRGFAMPKNAENKEAAKVFLKYALKEVSQEKSFETMGSCMDNGVVDLNALSPNQKIFFDSSVALYPIDNYVAEISYYNEIKDIYEKGLIRSVNAGSEADVKASVETLHQEISKVIEQNK